MKKTFTSMIAVILCAIITITGISSETAYAAGSNMLKLTFNKKSVTLTVNEEKEGVESVKLSTLKNKWGKPESSGDENLTTYTWEKGKTSISYTDYYETPQFSNFSVSIYDKNGSLCGIKVGMKKSKALKILKKLGTTKTLENGASVELASRRIGIGCTFKKGKVTHISCLAYAVDKSR